MDLETAKAIAQSPETHYSIQSSSYKYLRNCQALTALLIRVEGLERELEFAAAVLDTEPRFATIATSIRKSLEEG